MSTHAEVKSTAVIAVKKPADITPLQEADITILNKIIESINEELEREHGIAHEDMVDRTPMRIWAEVIRLYADVGWKVSVKPGRGERTPSVINVIHPMVAVPGLFP